MRLVSILLTLLVATSLVAIYVMEYLGGLRGMPMAIGGLPAGLLALLLAWLCILAIGGLLMLSIIKRNGYVLPASMLLLSVVLAMTVRSISPIYSFQIGFRKRIQSQVTPEELRQIAAKAQGLVPAFGSLPGPEKWSLWEEEEHRDLWDSLVASTAIEKLDPWLVIFNVGEAIELSWGGALVGHWGVVVEMGEDKSEGDIAEGVRTFTSSDQRSWK